jgi:hypothetical protein
MTTPPQNYTIFGRLVNRVTSLEEAPKPDVPVPPLNVIVETGSAVDFASTIKTAISNSTTESIFVWAPASALSGEAEIVLKGDTSAGSTTVYINDNTPLRIVTQINSIEDININIFMPGSLLMSQENPAVAVADQIVTIKANESLTWMSYGAVASSPSNPQSTLPSYLVVPTVLPLMASSVTLS